MLQGLTVQYPAPPACRAQVGRHDPVVRGGGRRASSPASGRAPRRPAHRHGELGGEGEARARARRGARDPLHEEDFVARVNEITGGKKVPVVYDSVGKDTFLKSLDCLQVRRIARPVRQFIGTVDALNTGLLSAKGSLYVTRPTLMSYTSKREELVAAAKELFDHVLGDASSRRARRMRQGRRPGAPRPRGPQDHGVDVLIP